MFGFRFIKAQPTTYIIEYKNGKVKREGAWLSFFYFSPVTSLVAVPLETTEIPFIINETTSDFQTTTIQGQIIYKVSNPTQLSSTMNYTLDAAGKMYSSEDPEKLQQRIVNVVQVLTRNELSKTPLKKALKMADTMVSNILPELRDVDSIKSLGIEILGLSIVAIKPNPETARALEAEEREKILQDADLATYRRRNSALEQERAIRENELNTELAVEQKKREIREAQMEAELSIQEKEHAFKLADLHARIKQEDESKTLVKLKAENKKILADAHAYEIKVGLDPYTTIDPKVLQALAHSKMDSAQLISQAFKDLSENAGKIGQLNVSSELLQSLLSPKRNA